MGRGLLLYVDKRIKANQVQMKQDYTENLCVEITGAEGSAIFGAVYRSPNSSSEQDKHLNKLQYLEQLTARKADIR